jgi:hypothetical protein
MINLALISKPNLLMGVRVLEKTVSHNMGIGNCNVK